MNGKLQIDVFAEEKDESSHDSLKICVSLFNPEQKLPQNANSPNATLVKSKKNPNE